MNKQMTRPAWMALWLLASSAATLADDATNDVADAKLGFFDTLAEVLPGNWNVEWADGTYDNPTSEWKSTLVQYSLTSGGTAIVEDYLSEYGGVPYMTTVYHQDVNDIRATHFCGAMNHPRMISNTYDPESKTLQFGFVDVSNLKAPGDYHSRGIELTVVDQDNVRVTFQGLEDGKTSSRVFAMSRATDDG